MATYRKLMKKVDLKSAHMGISKNTDKKDVLYSQLNNLLPAVYQGPVDRMAKYSIFDSMEQDSVINQGLDILADYTTQNETDEPFYLDYPYDDSLPEEQTLVLEKKFDEWVKLNSFKKRIHSIIRDTFKYGDTILIRDPETFILNKVNIADVVGVTAANDKTPTEYLIKNVELNVPLSVATTTNQNSYSLQSINTFNMRMMPSSNINNNGQSNNVNGTSDDMNVLPVAAENVVHLTMNIDDNTIYPFGRSVLEPIYKAYIQKMLAQDCVLLFRMKNATEKLVFKIPMGGIPAYMRRQYIERIRNDIYQRKMPSQEGQSPFNTIDVAYNSIPFNEDFFLPIDDNGTSPSIEKITGSSNLGEITDLVWFNNEEIRGLKIPSGWIPYGAQDGQRTVATSKKEILVQEQRFFLYCVRLQNIFEESFDREFKFYLSENGIQIDNDSFYVKFFKPANITELTQQEIDGQRLQNASSAMQIKGIAKQTILKRYLGWTEEEFRENEKLLKQEYAEKLKQADGYIPTEDADQMPGLRSIGISDMPEEYIADIEAQISANNNPEGEEQMGGGMPMGGEEPEGGMTEEM